MKKIFLAILLLFTTAFSNNNIVVNECISDVYYINGIMRTEEEAMQDKENIEKIMLSEIYDGDTELMLSLHNFELLYNRILT